MPQPVLPDAVPSSRRYNSKPDSMADLPQMMKEREEIHRQIKELQYMYGITSAWDPAERGDIMLRLIEKTEKAWKMKKLEDRIRTERIIYDEAKLAKRGNQNK